MTFRFRVRRGSQVPPEGWTRIPENRIGDVVAWALGLGWGIEIQPYTKAAVR